MSRTERIYRIDQLLHDRRLVSFQTLLDELEVSPATLKRDLEYLRDRLNSPIVWDREARGYRFDQHPVGTQYELPGLWFSSNEIHALLTMQHLLANLDEGGILTPHIQPLIARLNALMGSADNEATEIRKRVLIVGMGKRAIKLAHFERVGSALLGRKRLFITYAGRGRGETTEREISPQRLVYYRDNWYLDAWCHLREELRNFSLDAILRAEVVEKKAKEIAQRSVNEALGPGYGIFKGADIRWAKLRFTPERARWVSAEHWHPEQRGQLNPDGSYTLEIPYADDRELLMDILKHGAEVEVLAPLELRERVQEEIARMGKRYK